MSERTISLIDEIRGRLGLPLIDELRARVGLDTTQQVRAQLDEAVRDGERDPVVRDAIIDSVKEKLHYMLEDLPEDRIQMLIVHAGASRMVIVEVCRRAGGCPLPGTPAANIVQRETASVAACEAEIEELERTIKLMNEAGL